MISLLSLRGLMDVESSEDNPKDDSDDREHKNVSRMI
jgi:hypothetical protein